MAKIDYYNIKQQVRDLIDNNTNAAIVAIDEEVMTDADMWPWVSIYSSDRRATPGQPLTRGQRTNFDINLSIWAYTFSLDSIDQAASDRDDILGEIEIVLMNNRDLNGSVDTVILEGGELISARRDFDASFVMGGEIIAQCFAQSNTAIYLTLDDSSTGVLDINQLA